jgi:hypothetical protein
VFDLNELASIPFPHGQNDEGLEPPGRQRGLPRIASRSVS